MRPYSNRSQRGFSLMEILVAVAIISIILGMTMLNYSSILPNYKANSALDQLLYQLRSARERAISHRREVQVQFVGTNQLTGHCYFRRWGSVYGLRLPRYGYSRTL
jgi:prepilin-type N-terminal cleavage/methylation domain-containing protein